MKKYSLVVTETLQRTVEIEANDEQEALEKLEEMYYSENIVLDYQDFKGVEFSNCLYTDKEQKIMNQIHSYCQHDCGEGVYNCAEDECPLYRIEKIVE